MSVHLFMPNNRKIQFKFQFKVLAKKARKTHFSMMKIQVNKTVFVF